MFYNICLLNYYCNFTVDNNDAFIIQYLSDDSNLV